MNYLCHYKGIQKYICIYEKNHLLPYLCCTVLRQRGFNWTPFISCGSGKKRKPSSLLNKSYCARKCTRLEVIFQGTWVVGWVRGTETKLNRHSPSSLSLFISCCRVGRAYIPADTAFLMAHPWYGANTCWYAFDAGSFKEFPLPKTVTKCEHQLSLLKLKTKIPVRRGPKNQLVTDNIQTLQISKFCNNMSKYLATSQHLRRMKKQTKNLRNYLFLPNQPPEGQVHVNIHRVKQQLICRIE